LSRCRVDLTKAVAYPQCSEQDEQDDLDRELPVGPLMRLPADTSSGPARRARAPYAARSPRAEQNSASRPRYVSATAVYCGDESTATPPLLLLAVADADLTLADLSDQTVDATSANGAVVDFTPQASEPGDSTPDVTCGHPSGGCARSA